MYKESKISIIFTHIKKNLNKPLINNEKEAFS